MLDFGFLKKWVRVASWKVEMRESDEEHCSLMLSFHTWNYTKDFLFPFKTIGLQAGLWRCQIILLGFLARPDALGNNLQVEMGECWRNQAWWSSVLLYDNLPATARSPAAAEIIVAQPKVWEIKLRNAVPLCLIYSTPHILSWLHERMQLCIHQVMSLWSVLLCKWIQSLRTGKVEI